LSSLIKRLRDLWLASNADVLLSEGEKKELGKMFFHANLIMEQLYDIASSIEKLDYVLRFRLFVCK